jgi:hypothetical protein
MKKGFVFTIDAIVALSMVFSIAAILVPLSPGSASEAPMQVRIQRYTADLLAAMLKTGTLADALSGNYTRALSALDATSGSFCFSLRGYSMPSGNVSFALSKSSCGGVGSESSMAVAPAYNGTSMQIMELVGWEEQVAGS